VWVSPVFRTVVKSTLVRLVSSQRPLGDDRVDRVLGGRSETVVERPAALDVHKEQVTACVRVPGEGRSREQHVAEFPATVAGLLTLFDWLAAFGVEQVVMEATGVYWRPVWAILEDRFALMLVNARHVKAVALV
jgi:Transposase